MSSWSAGDRAICVVPCGTLELGCVYVVADVPGVGRLRRDHLLGVGLVIEGHLPPYAADGFDARRFLRASVDTHPEGQDRETGLGS